jgi:hypothetical protein
MVYHNLILNLRKISPCTIYIRVEDFPPILEFKYVPPMGRKILTQNLIDVVF